MRLGYSLNSAQPLDRSPASVATTLIDQARIATDAGFDYVQAGDHHATGDSQYFQNVPTLARLTAETDRVAPLFLLPLHHPVLVAEYCGTLSAFADGVDLWCAIGYRESEFDALGVPIDERVPRFEESLRIVRALSTGDSVTYDGTFYDVADVSTNPVADVDRVCIGGRAEPAVRRAGRMGDAWVVDPRDSPAEVRRRLRWFEDADDGDVVLRRDALILRDGDRAREVADQLIDGGYRDDHGRETLLVGDAQDVAEQLASFADIGVDEVVVRPMDAGTAEETLRECGRAVDLL